MSVALRAHVRPADIPAELDDFLDELPGPTAFVVPGRDRGRIRVVSGMLHGDEPSGVRAIHRALREAPPQATDVVYFVGAVDAARTPPRFSRRFLPGRRDLNRCFRAPWDGPDGAIAHTALELLGARTPELAVDLHNNTGKNPAYAIGPQRAPASLALAALFATRYIHSELALGTLTEALAAGCPSIAVECGRAHDPAADEVAWRGLVTVLALERLDVDHPPIEIFSSPQRVELVAGTTVAFAHDPDAHADLTLDPEIDRHNFQTVPAGTWIGCVRDGVPWPIVSRDLAGHDRSHELFARDGGGDLFLRQALVPIMLTTSAAAAAADCLFYVVQRVS